MVHSNSPGNMSPLNLTLIPSPNGNNQASPASTVIPSPPQTFHTLSVFNPSGDEFPDFQSGRTSLLWSSTCGSTSSSLCSCPACQRSDSSRPSTCSELSSSVFFGGPPAPMPVFQPRNLNMGNGRGQRVPPPPGMGAGQPGQQNPPPAPPTNMMGFQAGGINNHFYASAAAITVNLQTPGTYMVGITADITVGDRGSRGRAHQHPHHHHHHPGDAGHVDPATHGLDVTGHYHH